MTRYPDARYQDESWDELADHQFDHDPTPAQNIISATTGNHRHDQPKRIGLVHTD